MQLKLLTTVVLVMFLSGCGGGGGGDTSSVTLEPTTTSVTTVEDTPDITAPELTVLGSDPEYIAQSSTYTDAGAVAVDDRDGSVTVVTTGSVDTDTLGVYILTYTAQDSAGNIATATRTVNILDSTGFVTISGKITYDLIHVKSNYQGLDFNNITEEAAKLVVVEAINGSNQNIASTTTDVSGMYALTVVSDTQVKIRVSAKMIKAGSPSWNVKVLNQNNANALYVMEGSLTSSGTLDSQRNLNAASGWAGSGYTTTRVAAPFAILDSVYSAMKTVLNVDTQTIFPLLSVYWFEGSLDGTYYRDGGLYINGDADSDTDEYDDHVITHEWAHFYEDKFSRSDSIGGQHSGENILDIRVAFGEGWGNAFSGIALDDPVYFDTYDTFPSDGFFFNVESGTSTNKGWYSESSIQRILYDLYDSNDDGSDIISLGFSPIHKVFTGAEKITPAFTSIFSFISALKDENAGEAGDIDTLVSSESIAPITDIYGTGRTNFASELPNYVDLDIGNTVTVCPTYTYGTSNKLGNHKYIRFNITTAGNYTITVNRSSGVSTTDPDLLLYNVSLILSGFSEVSNSEVKTTYLDTASYKLDISDYKNISGACFDVTVE